MSKKKEDHLKDGNKKYLLQPMTLMGLLEEDWIDRKQV